MSLLPETFYRTFYTTARIIHEKDKGREWLWVNPARSHEFKTKSEAMELADLSNHNGSESGLDVLNYPYFVVRVEQERRINNA